MSLLIDRVYKQLKQQEFDPEDIRSLIRVVNLLLDERDLLYGWYVHVLRCEKCSLPKLCPAGQRRYREWENVARRSGELLLGSPLTLPDGTRSTTAAQDALSESTGS